jgi:dsRNA-specific ribonuclease
MEGPEHQPVFTVEVTVAEEIRGRGNGHSKQAAEQDAARQALDDWDERFADAEPAGDSSAAAAASSDGGEG